MGNIEKVDNLEGYIEELGKEVRRVKKASEYIKQIEQFQNEINQTSSTLLQTKDQLKIYQDIMESKLELFQSTSKNIEAKLQMLEQKQLNIIACLTEYKQQQGQSEKENRKLLNSIFEKVKLNQEKVVSQINQLEKNQELHSVTLKDNAKDNKMYFITTLVLGLSIAGMMIYMLFS